MASNIELKLKVKNGETPKSIICPLSSMASLTISSATADDSVSPTAHYMNTNLTSGSVTQQSTAKRKLDDMTVVSTADAIDIANIKLKKITKKSPLKITQLERPLIYIDLEHVGSIYLKHPLKAFGGVVQNVDGSIQDTYRIVWKVNDNQYEPKCHTEFWSKPPAQSVLQRWKDMNMIEEDNYQMGLWKVYLWIQDMFAKWPNSILASDNPTVDIGRLSAEIGQHLNLPAINYRIMDMSEISRESLGWWILSTMIQIGKIEIEYNMVFDTDWFMIGEFAEQTAMGCKIYSQDLQAMVITEASELGILQDYPITVEHTHDPVDDAMNNAQVFWLAYQIRAQRR
jgi:hypothetical protein